MKQTDTQKILFDRFSPWYYEAEVRQLEELSRQGWQLTARKIWKMEFSRDTGVSYRYAIDFRSGHDEARYLDIFRELGWELVSSIGDAGPVRAAGGYGLFFTPNAHPADGRWYFFRKRYDAALPEEDYLLDTDSVSKSEQKQRLARNYTWGAAVFAALSLLSLFNLLLSVPSANVNLALLRGADIILTLLLCFMTLHRRHIILNTPQKKKRVWDLCVYALLVAVFAGSLIALLAAARMASDGWAIYVCLGIAVLCAIVLLFFLLRGKTSRSRRIAGSLLWVAPIVLFLFGYIFSLGLEYTRDATQSLPPVTAENTPVRLFLQLDENTTIGQIEAQKSSPNWTFTEAFEISNAEIEAESGANLYSYIITPKGEDADGNDVSFSYWMNEGANGVVLDVCFSVWEDGRSQLLYATLTIKTDDGIASCYYYPTAYTQWGGETGFNLELKSAGRLFSHKYLLDTAQEVIDLAYPVVYPNGLE